MSNWKNLILLAFLFSCSSTPVMKVVVDVTKVKFIGKDGLPETGISVSRHYRNCSTEAKENEETLVSDANGEVIFPRRTASIITWKDKIYWAGFHNCSTTSNLMEAKQGGKNIWYFAPSYEDRTKPFDITVDINKKTASHGWIYEMNMSRDGAN